jgi:two-component system, cell cycle response regulator CpdR
MNRRSMTNDTDVPARHESAGVLYARASEYRRMATTASTAVDARALGDLAVRFTELADEREFQERLVRGETESPSCLPPPHALKIALDAARRNYAYPETMLDPVVASSIRKLAFELMAYGLAPPEPEPAVAESSKPSSIAQHVLVVDDSADVLVALGAFLLSAGFVVVSAPDGDTALRLIASNPEIGILVTDFVMPGLSGVDLIMQALKMRPDLKAVLITAYPGADGLAELPSHIKVLAKPFRRSVLIAEVKNLVSGSSSMLSDEAMELVENRRA